MSIDTVSSLANKNMFTTRDTNIFKSWNETSIQLDQQRQTQLQWRNTALFSTSNPKEQPTKHKKQMGLNEIQTLLREAVSSENYKEAARLRDLLADTISSVSSQNQNGNEGEAKTQPEGKKLDARKLKRLSWVGLGTAPWLVERLEALGYPLPTTIQIHAFESINAMLLDDDDDDDDDEELNTLEELLSSSSSSQRTLSSVDDDSSEKKDNLAVVVSGSTGSGKTLGFMVPLLSTLSQSLFTRQRIRVKAEEDIADAADDLLSRVAVITSPTVSGQGRKQVGGGGGGGGGGEDSKVASMGKSGKDVTKPLALIVVPTRELGVQTAMTLYELVGGNTKRTESEFGGERNMFKYKGPRGVKIGCILDEEEAKTGLKLQTDVAIVTPQYLTKLLEEGDIDPSKLRVVVYDEADLSLELTTPQDLQSLFHPKPIDQHDHDDDDDDLYNRNKSRLTYLVGASVTEALVKNVTLVKDVILPDRHTYLATATSFAPLTFDEDDDSATTVANADNASLKQLKLHLDPGLIHERCIAPNNTGLLCLCRMLRNELKQYSQKMSSLGNNNNNNNNTKIQRPRLVVFFPNETTAQNSIAKIRDAMWGDHRLSALLPNLGTNPMQIMEDFKRNKTTVLLATPNSVRGLDFDDLTHVYTLYLPADDVREYVHLAGRVGRIGQLGAYDSDGLGGRVTSILSPEEKDDMEELASGLGFEFVDVDYVDSDLPTLQDGSLDYDKADVEDMRRYLEDKITLLEDVNDPELIMMKEEAKDGNKVDDDDDDNEEE
eukprot:CAMPEP_0195509416 /NCGR_PEP_ID=MMETSP0794_2-20130614/2359_1 /TAXON_ID=515487 /ORGANISM="Stephanopyxis turris, Strain CCMP 815" /LENGTH=773 /DNA_ID=CAMNT_0040636633 /DNA_START=214 /DNA_END=2536 /DNA_ORIENTATION=+